MERTALRRRLTWQTGTVTQVREETSTARTIVLDLPDWPGHLAGQHLDVRLTAPDGYRASRSYSIASAWTGEGVELTVEQVPDGEVSPYLVEVLKVGDPLEVRGPVGGWFVWRPEDTGPVQLIGGGSGVVPLMAMLRTHAHAASTTPVRLLYSVRRPASVIYRPDLKDLAASDDVDVTFVYTREAPPGEPGSAGSTPSCSPRRRSGRPTTRPRTSAGRRRSSRRSPICWSPPGTTRAR